MSKTKDYFSTSDLNLSAVLVAHGETLEYLDKDPSGKYVFHFLKSSKLDDLIAKYWQSDLCIEPQTLFNSLKALKNRMYSRY